MLLNDSIGHMCLNSVQILQNLRTQLKKLYIVHSTVKCGSTIPLVIKIINNLKT